PINYTPEEAKSTTAYIVYSSGSTGKPKGVERTHTNVTAALAQLTRVDDKLGPHSVIMGVTQFCHAYALDFILHSALFHGATTIIHSSFNLETFCESIQKYKITHIYATPSIILELVNDPLTQKFDLSSVDKILSAAARLDYKLERKFYEMFKISVLQAYGSTEMAAVLRCIDTMKNAVPGSSGILYPNMKAKILSVDGREATDAVFDKDGFFSSGDIVSVDEQ
ncbi:16086_t:CDS:2, partial [Racocetra persica]